MDQSTFSHRQTAVSGAERTCECGCGAIVLRRFVSGHNTRGLVRTAEWRAKQATGMTRAWATSRFRKPLGSTRTDHAGYLLVKVSEGNHRWEKQHILVVEESIGRRLEVGEQVHHVNGRKQDNRIENLFLCATGSEHQLIERSFNRLLGELIDRGVVELDRKAKVYRLV